MSVTLTLQNIPLELDAALRQKAEEQQRPVDQIAVEAMKVGLGLEKGAQSGGNANLAASIRGRFGALGGIELAEPIREPIPEPPDLR
jgi:hypothetical protein